MKERLKQATLNALLQSWIHITTLVTWEFSDLLSQTRIPKRNPGINRMLSFKNASCLQTLSSWAHLVIPCIQSCVSQSDDPVLILAYKQLNIPNIPFSNQFMMLLPDTNEPVYPRKGPDVLLALKVKLVITSHMLWKTGVTVSPLSTDWLCMFTDAELTIQCP